MITKINKCFLSPKKIKKSKVLTLAFILQLCNLASAEQLKIYPQQITPSLPAREGNRVVTSDFLLNIPSISDNPTIQWLDQQHLIYSLPPNSHEKLSQIGLINIGSKTNRNLGLGEMPKPSPDGKQIAYIREVEGKKQLWLMQNSGKIDRQLTHITNGLSGGAGYHYDFAWSPDSKKIIFSYQPEVEFWNRVKKKVDKSKSSATSDENIYSKLPLTSIYVIDTLQNKTQLLVNLDARLRYPSFLQNGEDLLFLMEREALSYNQKNDEGYIASLHLTDKKIQKIFNIRGLQQALEPVASKDGKRFAFNHDPDSLAYSVIPSLWIGAMQPNTKFVTQQLTQELKLFSPKWSGDGASVYAIRGYGSYRQIYSINVNEKTIKQITQAPLNIESYALSPDGNQLAWIGQDAHANRIIRMATKDGKDTKDLLQLSATPKNLTLSEVREVEWHVPSYPNPMRGLLIMPLHYQTGTRYPLITDIHGGGISAHIYLAGAILTSTPLEWQLWAAKGYAVFVPDFRSSGAFGSIAIKRDEYKEHDLVNKDTQDIIAGIDSLISKGIVDANRIAIIGHSAGGRRVNWLAVSSHRFKALVSKEGWADEWLLSGINPMKRLHIMYGGTPVEAPENYQKNSSLFHAKGATTPILFLMSSPEKGADQFNTVRWLYHAIKSQGVETQYIQYPDEGHVLERLPNKRDALDRTIHWIDGHLK